MGVEEEEEGFFGLPRSSGQSYDWNFDCNTPAATG